MKNINKISHLKVNLKFKRQKLIFIKINEQFNLPDELSKSCFAESIFHHIWICHWDALQTATAINKVTSKWHRLKMFMKTSVLWIMEFLFVMKCDDIIFQSV